jgi:hypothetical protein
MKERGDAVTSTIAQGAVALDKTIKDRTDAFTNLVSQGAVLFDNTLKQRTEALTVTIGQGAAHLDKTLKDRTDQFVSSVGQGAGSLEKTLKDRTENLTNLVSQGAVILDRTLQERTNQLTNTIGQGAAHLDKTLQERTNALTTSIGQGAVHLDKTLQERTNALTTSIGQGATLLDKTLNDRTGQFNAMVDQRVALMDRALQDRTSQFIAAINNGAIALDKSLAERAEGFTNSLLSRVKTLEQAIGQQTGSLDKTMTERAQAVIMALAERLQAIETTFNQRTAETDRMLGEHTRSSAEAFGKHTAQLNQVLANNSAMMQQTANQVGAQSKEAVTILTSQTQTLREVSRGLLDQIHGLTQRFENQGQAILTAAKALDSSNTKIDSILEGRHQAIIALLHTVNTKAQDLDNMMRSYAGMVENAMSQAEQRAKQVGTAFARDTSNQAQQALAQIERLREEAQAHTQRAVNDLKGSFEQIITQIGRQLEQMRGTFDNTSRGMREAAQKTATDLDGLRTEMQKRMESLPEQTAQAAEAVRKALSEQIKEIEAQTVAAQQAAAAAAPKAFELPPMPRDTRPLSGGYEAPPLPAFDTMGRQTRPGHDDLGRGAGGLAQQLASPLPPRTQAPAADDGRRGAGSWSVGDLLSRASDADQGYQAGGQSLGTRAAPTPPAQASSGGQLRLDEIARAIDYRTAVDVWQRFRTGERGVLGRHIYSAEGQATFDEVARRYDREADFRGTVDRYIGDFERLLGEAEASDPEGRMLQNYLTSESGRVYLLLAHASGRLH